MDAKAALDRLSEISSQVRAAVIFERGGKVVGSTLAEAERAETVAREAEELLTAAERRRPDPDEAPDFAQLEVALREGSVFVVRDNDRLIAATTPPEPTVGLVFYDLKSCLRDLEDSPPARSQPKRKTTTRKKSPPKKSDAKP